MTSLAVISNNAFSVVNFRGPLLRALADRNVRVFALAPDYTDLLRDEVRALGAEPIDISLERAGLKPHRDLFDVLKLTRMLKRLKPDISFAYFVKPVVYGGIAAALAGVPKHFAMIEGLGYVFGQTPDNRRGRRLLRWLTERLYKLALRKADQVFFCNLQDIEEISAAGLIAPGKAVNMGAIGVDLEQLQAVPVVSHPVTFLLMARLLREKGVCEFAAAARRMKALHPDLRFILLGELDPNPNSVTLDEVQGWVREGLLEWPGHVQDVRPWIAQSSVFVLPSYYREGVPRSTQEAMAMARPVITTDNVGCRDTVVDGVNGFMIPVRDVDALVQAMLRFVEEPKLIAAMGRESRRLAEERFDVRKINDLILDVMGFEPRSPRLAKDDVT